MKFTEYQLEKAFIELLKTEEIPHINGATISRDIQEVLIEDDLKSFLLAQYKSDKLTNSEADQIIRQLKTYSASDLYESNKSIMKLVADGFSFKREDRSQKDIWIYLIDFSEENKNTYKFINQLEIVGYENLITNLKETGRLRNLVVHADWENTDDDGYTYVNLRISKNGMEQEYLQFSEDSLKEIIKLIFKARIQLGEYWEKRNEELYKN